MPWVHGDNYMARKNAELKYLLLLRGLPHSGTKEKMASRLIAHDEHHPFPFKKLPPEIRNEIYELVASQDAVRSYGSNKPVIGHTESLNCFQSLEAVTARSSLFRTCKQTRAEGLMLFYQNHHIELAVDQNIGVFARKNIRHMNITYMTKCSSNDRQHVDRIHLYLHEEATVTYSSYDYPETLWMLGASYEQLARGVRARKVPIFRIGGADGELTTYRFIVDFRELRRNWGRLQYSIVFYPGKFWFGGAILSRLP